MERLPTTVIAAVGLGIVGEAVFQAWSYTAARPVVITAIIAVALLTQKGTSVGRLRNSAISTWQTTREIRPVPTELRREKPVIAAQIVLAILIGIALVAVPLFMAENRVSQIATMAIYAIVGIALVMLTGWAGQVSLGQMTIVGVSGAVAGWFAINFVEPIVGGTIPAMILAGIAGALVTVLIGIPTLRARGFTFAVMTAAFTLMASDYFLNAGHSPLKNFLPTADSWFNAGDPIPRPPVISFAGNDFIPLTTETRLYWMSIAMLLLVVVAARGLRRSRTGRVLIGVRENERAAEAYSVSATRTLVLAFAVSGFVTGIAGALFQFQQKTITVKLFDLNASLQLFAMVVVGGLGSIGGAVLGAVYVFGAQYFLPPGGWSLLATGAGMLIILLIAPGGLGAALGDARDGALRWYARRKGIRVPSLLADTRVVDEVLPPEAAEAFEEAMERPEVDTLAEMHD
jgi:branched-chain amino acid transport system permease protein